MRTSFSLLSVSHSSIIPLVLLLLFLDPMLGNWPSFDPQNFSQFKPNDPSNPSKMTPITYQSTNERTLPPPHQVIGQEPKNILLRHIYQQAEEKLRPKRGAHEAPVPERASKVPRPSAADTPL